MLFDELRDAVEVPAPLLVRGDGTHFDLVVDLEGQVHLPCMARIDDQAVGRAVGGDVAHADQEPGDLVNGALSGGEPDSCDGLFRKGTQTLGRDTQMRAALIVGDGVKLVEDQRARAFEALASALRGEKYVQRLGVVISTCGGRLAMA